MNISTSTVSGVSVVTVQGTIDSSTAPAAQEQILPLVQPGCRLLLDMSRVDYMSSAGLRMMLLLYRRVAGGAGRVVLAGLSEDIKDTMSLTGFLDFFHTCDTLDSGLASLSA